MALRLIPCQSTDSVSLHPLSVCKSKKTLFWLFVQVFPCQKSPYDLLRRATVSLFPLVLLPSITPAHFDPRFHWQTMILVLEQFESVLIANVQKTQLRAATLAVDGTRLLKGQSQRVLRRVHEEEELRLT